MLRDFLQKWRRSSRDRTGLDVLLAQAPLPSTPLRERLAWFGKMVHWIRSPGLSLTVMSEAKIERLKIARLKYVLQILEQNVALKARISDTLGSIVRDTQALELLMSVGIPGQQGFILECFERLHLRLLPQPPQDADLVTVFSQTFRFRNDAQWIGHMDLELFRGWMELFRGHEAGLPGDSILRDARDAVLLLSQSISTIGVSRWMRERVKVTQFRELAFYELPDHVKTLLQATEERARKEAYQKVRQTLDRCSQTVNEVYTHFRERGVSIELVYQIERLKSLIKRLRTLCRLLTGYENDPRMIRDFVASLIEQNYRARSIRGLIADNIALVCHKIVETNAETGEHYISRDMSEQLQIVRGAAGGGFITGFTTLGKVMIHPLDLAPFAWGFLASVNYALSFFAIQLTGSTLATKQPAMTATVLASKLDETSEDTEEGISPFIDEFVHLLRSQIVTILGNLSAVVPTVFLINWIMLKLGRPLMEPEYAKKVVASFSLLGATPFLAIWTGIMLWASSVFSGLFANWFSFRRLPEAIEHHPRIIYVLGPHRAERVAAYLRRSVAGFASNASLGFLLGMSLPVGAFFGVPLDVRHVTLSCGMMAAACASLGQGIFLDSSFWWALGGLFSMGVFNLAVAFSLALIVAIWAKRATAPSRSVVYRALMKRLLSKPWLLFLPARKAPASAGP